MTQPNDKAELSAPKKPTGLKGLINQTNVREQIRLALPTHLKPERFIRIATTALSRVPKLAACTPESFMRCLLDLSALGLEPDGRKAHLIPYGSECTLVLDYKGIVELVRRSGDVSDIHCDVVRENDDFRENLGLIECHRIDRRKPRGEVYAVYSRVVLKDGTISCEVMSSDEVEAVRKRSRASSSGPWVTDWCEMAKKTVFRRHSKWLPMSAELRDAIEKDDDQFEMRNVTPAPNPFAALPVSSAEEGETEEAAPPAPAKKRGRTRKDDPPAQETVETTSGEDSFEAEISRVEEMSGGWCKLWCMAGGEEKELRINDADLAAKAKASEWGSVTITVEGGIVTGIAS